MPDPTDRARRAANHVADQQRFKTRDEAASIIDRTTGLPELLRELEAIEGFLHQIVDESRGHGFLMPTTLQRVDAWLERARQRRGGA